ncbi:MAG: DUF6340 family protein [Agriterribacter sp.]
MKKYIFIISASIIFSSCASTNSLRLTVTQPAPVTVPAGIKKVAIINRSEISKQNEVIEVVDKVFSLEEKDLDKDGSASGVTGLREAFLKYDRFNEVILQENRVRNNAGPGIFPSPILWDDVTKLCNILQVDAIFVLELFDTDSKISYTTNPVTKNTPLGKVSVPEHTAHMVTHVKMGWRLYDPAHRDILDEYPYETTLNFYGKGINPATAAAALTSRKDAVKQAARQAADEYALRIFPYSLRVARDYYVKGTDNFKIAKRKAQTGNWDGAAVHWNQEINNADGKIAGRACYNMAIISEINGDLSGAIAWAQKSYEQYSNRLALSYLKILKGRQVNEEILKEQNSHAAR